MVKGYIFCYRTSAEANKMFDQLVELRTKTNIKFNLIQLSSLDEIPYPYWVSLAVCNDDDFGDFDKFLAGIGFDSGDADTYALEGRVYDIIYGNVVIIRRSRWR